MKSFQEHNKHFYDKSDSDWLVDLAQKKGLDKNVDFEAVRSIIASSRSMLEVGSGYGRLPRWLQVKLPEVEYLGVDFSQVSVNFCKNQFQNKPSIDFVCEDICDFRPQNKFDLVLWPWSGFLELVDEEKIVAIKNIFQMLGANGVFGIDVPHKIAGGEKLVYQDSGVVEQHSRFGYVLNKVIDIEAIVDMCVKNGFKKNRSLVYETSKNIKREWLLFTKNID